MNARTRGLVVAGMCVALALACAVVVLRPDPAASGSTTPGAATPAWSVRRVPGPVVELVAGQRLAAGLAETVAGLDACVGVDTAGRIVDMNAAAALVPASTLKVLTAIGALEVLGADHRFSTDVGMATGADPTAPERLYLFGGGDPLLGTDAWRSRRDADPTRRATPTTSLEQLADAVVAAGVRSVPGGVVGVSPDLGDPTFLEHWNESYRASAIGPMGMLTVNGGYHDDGSPADEGPAHAASELSSLLEARGVAVGPPSGTRGPPDDTSVTVFASVESADLATVVGVMLATSDNLTAEMLVRAVARHGDGLPHGDEDSTTFGVRRLGESFARLGLPLEGFTQVDGSGLSTDNRVTCDLLDAALALAETDPRFAAVRSGMSVAGEIGTLAPRLGGTPLTGALAAKTGTLPGVTGLTGWITVGDEIRFAFVANGAFSQTDAMFIREDVALVIGRHPDAPPPDVLVPVP